MKRFTFLSIMLALLAGIGNATQNVWKSDASHSGIGFSVTHLVISDVEGRFKEFEATMTGAKNDFTDAVIEVKIKASSIDTDNERRDNHLRSADFFDAEKHPEATFKSNSIKQLDKTNYVISGELTMRGVSKPVELRATLRGTTKDPWGNSRAGFRATATINRTEWGLTWNKPLENGGWLVGEEVTLTINVEFVLQKPEQK